MHAFLVPLALMVSMDSAQGEGRVRPDPPIDCDACEGWNRAREPFRLFGNTYYVGVSGLSAILVASDDGLILLDGGLPQSAPRIEANIRKLGFRMEDVRLIGNSHAHFDHAGGIAALQRASGATVVASPAGARALGQGMPTADDPQAAFGESGHFPPVPAVRGIDDGETLRVGNQEIIIRFTPGHTPGGTSWTWRSCEGSRCLDMVYADSLTAVSAPGFRFTGGGDEGRPSIVETFRGSIATVASLPCDILVSTHPEFSNLFEKLDRRERGGGRDALVDTEACRDYAAAAAEALDERIERERSSRVPLVPGFGIRGSELRGARELNRALNHRGPRPRSEPPRMFLQELHVLVGRLTLIYILS